MSSAFKFEISHMINENIERVWVDIRSFTLFQSLLPEVVSKSVLLKGSDSWSIGSIYETLWIGVSKLTATCIDVENSSSKKRISYHITSAIDVSYIKTISLFAVTSDDSAFAILEISVSDFNQFDQVSVLAEEQVQSYKSIYKQFFSKYEQYLRKTISPSTNYESCLIKCERKGLWDLITDMNQTSNQLTGVPKLKFEYSAERHAVGTVIKGINLQTQKTSFFFVKSCVQEESEDKWVYSVQTLGSSTTVSHQLIEINLIKVTDEMCQVSFLHTFQNGFNKESINNLSREKQSFLAKLKQIFEIENSSSIVMSSQIEKAPIEERVI